MRAGGGTTALVAAMIVAGCGSEGTERSSASSGGDRSQPPVLAAPETPVEPPAPAPAPTPWFERSDDSGLDFEHVSGEDGTHRIMSSLCGGVGLVDVDGDGDLDAYFVQSGSWTDSAARGPNRLYLNDGTGRFTDVTEGSGAGDRGYGMGLAAGDYDGDGDQDLFIANVGRDTLLRNDGEGRFTDVTEEAGVGDLGFGTGAAFLDADGDGDLDLWVLRYLDWRDAFDARTCRNRMGEPDYCVPTSYEAASADLLWRNEGDGTFTDVSSAAGIASVRGTGLGIVVADFDGDGRRDVFVANDAMKDRLWKNLGGMRFRDEGLMAGVATDGEGRTTASMGVSARDFDADGDLDLVVCNVSGESDTLFRNEGGFFEDATNRMGLGAASRSFTRFGQAWHDFDHDGVLDLYQANGRVMRQQRGFGADDPYAEPNQVFRGRDGGRYEAVEPRGGVAEELVATSRGAAFGDVDGDGDVDVLVANRDGRPHLLLNRIAAPGTSATFDLREADGRLAIGATLMLEVAGQTVRLDPDPAYSYFASNDPRAHVGLAGSAEAEAIRVRWPDGSVEAFGRRGPGLHRLVRGTGDAADRRG